MNRFSETTRRHFLRATGVTLALPTLESVRGESVSSEETLELVSPNAPAKRLFCVGANLGYYRPAFYPKQTGRNYEMSEHLQHLEEHRNDFTVFSGLDHRAGNGHNNWDNFLCGPQIGSITLDQVAAEKIAPLTRIPSFQLCAGGRSSGQKLSYNRQGVPLPLIERPSVIYKQLFSSAEDRKRTDYLLRSGQSALDTVLDEALRLEKTASSADRVKLDEYFTSLREMEKRMTRQIRHLKKPQQKVDYKLPPYDPISPVLMLEAEKLMYDLVAIAFQVDATRVASMYLAGLGQVFTIEGETLRAGYHALSHHGNDPDMIRDLIRVEAEHIKHLGRFTNQLKTKTDADGRPLLDSTIVLFGTGMGDANRHANDDLPTLIAGGGFKHGQHIATDKKASNAHRMGDLHLTLLHQLGVEEERFAEAERPMAI
ncbi:MAG: DUF1552 domain-containing protein [Verrucomicrobiota bacterium]